ncbi:uncharacterized protein STEHIDRAFT_137702 [Stereum hirsutum FP-91666 SS1]|uniref:uncharacterized protein n=1 Tax=Stereum hirsutum (strain FP-91666) TaxID=721885 RepID=UPI000440C43F|nr:uncharacterized protein STEHIDRAFT_137702 [Stereum hirsutum FP-91666 SS1]EIM90210.1 hypothetical protein STEHIDRAFT_137702 [Stereum hirsutum FP-91666 SS1]
MPSPREERRESQAPYYPVSSDPNAPETEPLTGPTSDATNDNGAMGNEEQMFVKPEARRGDQTALIAAIVSAGVLVLFTWAIVFYNDPIALGWFSYHPMLQTLAIFAFTIGILSLQPTSQPRTKAAGLKRHQLAMILGLISIVLGTSAMLYTKASHNAPHFTTWHGLFGIISFVWLIAQFSIGAASVWFDGKLFGGGMRAKLVYKYHRHVFADPSLTLARHVTFSLALVQIITNRSNLGLYRLSGYIIIPLTLLTVNFAGAYADWVIGGSAYIVRLIAYTIAPVVLLVALYVRVRPSKMKFF